MMKVVGLTVCSFVLLVILVGICHGKDLTLVQFTQEEVAESGAVCLDGTPPAFFYRRGTGSGEHKWIINMVGGAWCFFDQFSLMGKQMEWMGCYERSKITWREHNGTTGTTRDLPPSIRLEGIFSDEPSKNTYFHNWNHVHLVYCDGFSFAGDREEPVEIKSKGVKLYLRGRRILKAVLERLTNKHGMVHATDVILSGCSSGGLGVYINADMVKEYLQDNLVRDFKYKALADGGYFLDVEWDPLSFAPIDLPSFKDLLYIGAQLHGATSSLNPTCKRVEWWRKWKCVIPKYFYEYIETPVFVLNPYYDSYQISMIKGLFCLPPECSPEKMVKFYESRDEFIDRIEPIFDSKQSGAFINSCVIHCQAMTDKAWKKYKIDMENGFTYSVEETFARWYYDEGCSCEDGSKLLVYDRKPWPENHYCPEVISPLV